MAREILIDWNGSLYVPKDDTKYGLEPVVILNDQFVAQSEIERVDHERSLRWEKAKSEISRSVMDEHPYIDSTNRGFLVESRLRIGGFAFEQHDFTAFEAAGEKLAGIIAANEWANRVPEGQLELDFAS